MHDFLIALVFVSMVVSPAFVASVSSGSHEDDSPEPDQPSSSAEQSYR